MAILAGCTSYNFQITKPENLAALISESPHELRTPNLTYRMQAMENRLVILAFNETDKTNRVMGDRSFVVDPNGASHPLRSQSIAPHSHVKLILPPLYPPFPQPYPRFEIEFNSDGMYHSRNNEPTPVQYLGIYEESDSYYWKWDGQASIRLSITCQREDGTQFTDNFTITKVKER